MTTRSTAARTSPSVAIPPARDGWADAVEEARELEHLTLEERFELFEGACAAVFEILEHHPQREEILAYRDPVSTDARTGLKFSRPEH